MRKVLLSLVAIAAAVFATSCTNDLLDEGVKGGNRVTFNISTPELATRAFGDGATATDLYYAVYEGNTLLEEISVLPDGENPVKLQGGKTSIMLDLASGIEYNLIFWAAAPDAIGTLYEVDFANKSMSLIEPDKFVSQNEKLDAFYAYVDEVEAGKDEEVELYRPFAQLNISVSDADILAAKNANLTVAETKVVVKNAYKTLNLVNGDVADEVAYTFDFAAAPTGDNAADFPKADYTRYAMNYLLVDDTKKLVEVEFAYNRAVDANAVNTRTFGNVPVQRNYRTNIYGDLLTKSTGFEVEIMEDWTEPDHIQPWNGTALEEPAIDANGNVLVINAAQLAYVATAINGGDLSGATTRAAAVDYSNKTILLTGDIDLNNKAWTPIGLNADDAKKFKGTFDGQGYTISNLNVKTPAGYTAAGLFGALNGTAKNFTIENATIEHLSSGNATDNGIAVVAGSIYSTGTIENVKVKGATVKGNRYVGGISGYTYGNVVNCSVEDIELIVATDNLKGSYDNGDKVGGIAGYYGGESTYKFSGNSVKNATITAYRDFGGVVGTADDAVVENCSIENVTLIVDNSQNYKGYTSFGEYNVGSIVGRFTGSTTEKNNSGEATIKYEDVVINPDGSYSLNEEEGMQTLIDMLPAGEETTVKLEDGDYVVDNAAGKNIRFIANGEDVNLDITITDHVSTTFADADLYFEGVNFNVDGKYYYGQMPNKYFTDSNSETYVNCTFNKYHYFSAKKALVKDCVFNGVEGQYFWTGAAAEVEFDGCTFNGVDRALKVASVVKAAAPLKVTINNCDFTATVTNKAVLEIGAANPTNDFVVEVKNSNRNSVFNGWYAIEAGNNVDINIDGAAVAVTSQEELNENIAANATIVLPEGEFTLGSCPAGVTLIGSGEDTVVDVKDKKLGVNGDVTIKNMTVVHSNADYTGFQHTGECLFEDCVIVGQPFLYGTEMVFNRCTFEQESSNAYNVWTYGAKNVTFNECTFNSAGKAILVYKEAVTEVYTVTFNDCKINASTPVEGKAAIEIDSSFPTGSNENSKYVVNINNTTATGFANGSVSGNSLWNNKKGSKAEVNVDGVKVL